MKSIVSFLLVALVPAFASGQGGHIDPNNSKYFACSLTPTIFHINETCEKILPCAGGKRKQVKDISNLTPCRKCAWPEQIDFGFTDIKRIMRKTREEVIDQLGKGRYGRGDYQRDGFAVSVPFDPSNKWRVNVIGFTFSGFEFRKEEMLSDAFYKRLGLDFEGCLADTVCRFRPFGSDSIGATGHRKAQQQDVVIYYKGCAKIAAMEKFEDTSQYFYELHFIPRSSDLGAYLAGVSLRLRKKGDFVEMVCR